MQIISSFRDITERKYHERQQEYLLKIIDALRALSDAAEIEEMACCLLGEHLGVNRAYYSEISEPEGYARVERQFLRGMAPLMAGIYPSTAFSWSLPLLRRGEPVIVEDIHQPDKFPPADVASMETIQQLALISVPLVKNGVLAGALTVSENAPRVWKPEEVELVHETLERTWAVAQRARAKEALRESEERLRALIMASTDVVYRITRTGAR
jgi:GAF domain-containing protein